MLFVRTTELSTLLAVLAMLFVRTTELSTLLAVLAKLCVRTMTVNFISRPSKLCVRTTEPSSWTLLAVLASCVSEQ